VELARALDIAHGGRLDIRKTRFSTVRPQPSHPPQGRGGHIIYHESYSCEEEKIFYEAYDFREIPYCLSPPSPGQKFEA